MKPHPTSRFAPQFLARRGLLLLPLMLMVTGLLHGDGDSCLDFYEECPKWAKEGRCERKAPVKQKCSYSCAVCVDHPTPNGMGGDLGVPQALEFNDGILPSDIYWMITKARSYMKYVVHPAQLRKQMPRMCKNKHEYCAYWALLGECAANPKYMLKNCAPVCTSCDST